ncbi:hypothetical protein C2G38_2196937 [Gigaspora rosea]|uniref:Uncharacterized protein n=1 Tax=Gigaspora rosea TaxID=44941 RepID=A0A397V363_9GLOM|nr:hypothetical protein C2G38_2196937 [Gigaspora rosea]
MPYGGKKGDLHLASTCPVDTSLTLIQSVFTQPNIYSQAAVFAIADPILHTHLLIKVFDRIKQKQWVEAKFLWVENLLLYNKLKTGYINLFGSLSELFFEQFFQDSLDWNFLLLKAQKPQSQVLPGGGNYFETCLKYWQELFIVSCGSELVTINGKKPKDVPANAYKVDKYASLESRKIKHLYLCAGINITDEEFYLESKDLPEEISFPEDVHIKQRYRFIGASFCDSNHHIADVRFENVKNAGWYQYDSLGKTYRARAMFIGNSRPPCKNGYAMDFAIYVKI